MFALRPAGVESWLDPEHARRLSAALAERLWARCQGHRGLFVTLTYRRDEYASALDLYRQQGERQDVALFIRKVGRFLGRDLRGKWLCKLEFQRGGWVHFHLIILDVERIPHAECTDLWGHGHVWLRRLNRSNVKYCTKYVVKEGAVPAWLYMERPRSVKIIRTSHGFWGRKEAEHEDDDEDDTAKPDAEGMRCDFGYVPIGARMEQQRHALVARDDEGRYRRCACDLGPLLVALLEAGCGVVGRRGRWLEVDGDLADLQRAVGAAGGVWAGGRSPPAPLHLREPGKSDADRLPWYLENWFREMATVEEWEAA